VAGWLAWRRAREEGRGPGWISALRLPRGRRSLVFWVPAGVLALPLGLGLLAAATDKMRAAAAAMLPGGDLRPWSGKTPGFQPIAYFLGVPVEYQALALLIVVLAAIGLWRAPRDARTALGVVLVAMLLGAAWFSIRGAGALFHFRALSFYGPTLLVPAGLGAAWLLRDRRPRIRVAALAGLALLGVAMLVNVRDELKSVFPHVTRDVWELRTWNDRIPKTSSIRVDVTPVGVQEWAGYMLSKHPQSASHPLLFFFPHPPVGRKADYLLVNRSAPHPADAAGPPVLRNGSFKLYGIRANVPGRDVSSRELVDPQRAPGASAGE
jgi:hypothetical protein